MAIERIDAPTWNVQVMSDFPLLDDPQGFVNDDGETVLRYIETEPVQEWVDVVVAHRDDILETASADGRSPVFLNLDTHIVDRLKKVIGACPLEGNCVLQPSIDGVKGQDMSEATVTLSCVLKGLLSAREADEAEARCETHHETAPDSVEEFCAEVVTNVREADISRGRADERYVSSIADL